MILLYDILFQVSMREGNDFRSFKSIELWVINEKISSLCNSLREPTLVEKNFEQLMGGRYSTGPRVEDMENLQNSLFSRASEGNGTLFQYSCLENPMNGGAWWAAVHGVAKSRTWLSDFTFTFHFHALEKEMATHSSVLAWRIRGTGEPGGLPSMGSHRVGHDWSDLAAAAAAQTYGGDLDKKKIIITRAILQVYVVQSIHRMMVTYLMKGIMMVQSF